jgi:hypothetical protein
MVFLYPKTLIPSGEMLFEIPWGHLNKAISQRWFFLYPKTLISAGEMLFGIPLGALEQSHLTKVVFLFLLFQFLQSNICRFLIANF